MLQQEKYNYKLNRFFLGTISDSVWQGTSNIFGVNKTSSYQFGFKRIST